MKTKMKIRTIAFLLCVALCFAAVGCSSGDVVSETSSDVVTSTETSSKEEVSSEVSSKTEESSSKVSSAPVSSKVTSTVQTGGNYTNIDTEEYLLMLVNPWKPLPQGFKPKTTPIPAGYGTWANMSFADVGFNDLIKMMDDARSEGANLILVSSTRTQAEQTSLFENNVNNVLAANPSYTRKQAEEEAAKSVAVPGTSEHQLGLAVDFNSTEDSFRNTKEYKWLKENAYKYGFILRYHDDKQSVTGIIPEPWHYRYVGKENAKKIYDSGLVLEEYLAN